MKVRLKNENIKKDYGRELLRLRGVKDVQRFIFPDANALQSWRDLDNIENGIQLIKDLYSYGAKEAALIVDCDVDGYTSAAIIYQYLKRLCPLLEITPYLHEGKAHGLEEHWEEIREKEYNCVIIPDAGSNDAQYAKELNCPVLIIDHHLVEEQNFTPNMIVINNQISPKYSNKSLSGAGMALQFCRALDDTFGLSYSNDYWDLAALGICGDMMNGLEIENQYIWNVGFNHVQNPFFMAIAMKQAYSITGKMNTTWGEIQEALDPTTVAFYIVPLINAMVRVGTQEEKERMFIAFVDGHRMIPCNKRGAKGTLEEACIESVRECVNARSHQNKAKDAAVARLEQKIFKHDLLENKILFVRLEDDDVFPAELNGLVAMQLSAKYKRPTIVARLNDEGYIRGSSRGLSNSELESFKKYMDSTGLFEYTAGHDNACGISILNTNLPKLHEMANHDLAQYNFGDGYYEVDFERQALADDLGDLIEDLTKYKHIWSQGNEEPLIYIRDLHISKKDIQVMGKNSDTIKFVKNGVAYLKFFAKDLIEEFNNYDGDIKLEVVGKANLNNWMGTITPQIIIENCEVKEDKLLDF